ncbi:nicotinamide N-methyltransferase-like [Hyperolius riggenbachi]|uniref:nicotinamide N-methyltransferase-like n=1 Tax=Hyperolius riggenbachi TaxID=752182 RepID=UPI0035A37783
MSDFSGPGDYQKLFDPQVYLKTYYSTSGGDTSENEYLQFVLTNLAEIFNSGKVKGETLIDISSGPTIYQLLSACEAFENIIASDFTDQNREVFKAWLTNQPEAFNWSPVVKYVCQLEGNKVSWKEKEDGLRNSIKQVLKCDVMKDNPMDPVVLPPVDCLLSCLCLEAACKDLASYVSALRNLSTLLKPGGHLVIASALEGQYYLVGDVRFSALSVTEASVRESLSKAGYVVEKFERSTKSEKFWENKTEFTDYFVMVARKNA